MIWVKTIAGMGSGSDAVVAIPALSGGTARADLTAGKVTVDRRTVTVPLSCAGAGALACRYKASLSAKQGAKTVLIAARTGTLRGGRKLQLRLKPGAAGRSFLEKHRLVQVTLVVTQIGRGAQQTFAARERLSL